MRIGKAPSPRGARLFGQGKSRAALPLAAEAVKLRREVLGEKHPWYATALSNLAMLYQDLGEHRTALPLLQQSLDGYRALWGEKHPLYASSLNNLAILSLQGGRPGAALALCGKALAIHLAHVENSLSVVDDRQQLLLLHEVSWMLSFFITLATDTEVGAGELYRWVVRLKGALASRGRLDRLARRARHP
jgi:tetratricopeptide (TPR) repeat protein